MIDSTYRLYDDNLILILFLRMVSERGEEKASHKKWHSILLCKG